MTTGTYEAVFYSSWKIDDLRLDDGKYEAARSGDTDAQNYIILRYKAKLRKKYGVEKFRQLPRIYWDDKYFDIRRIGDALSATVPPVKRSKAKAKGPSGSCDCECTQCDIGYHCHEPDTKCHMRPY